MKKFFKKIVFAVFISLSSTNFIFAQGTGIATFDLSAWLQGIDALYNGYDMIENSITQIENQYKQIQMALEQARKIDWTNIEFDGDLDIRDEIRSGLSKVNRLATNARKIEETITEPSIDCGFGKYSIADLCGHGADGKSLSDALDDMQNYMSVNMKIAIHNMEEGLTEEQKKAIWKKYGISPANYLYIQQAAARFNKQAAEALAEAAQQADETKKDSVQVAKENIIQACYQTLDPEGNITDGALKEALVRLNDQMINGILDLKGVMTRLTSLYANQQILKKNQEEVKQNETTTQTETDSNRGKAVSSSFKLQ